MPGFATRAVRAASRVPDAPQAPVNAPIYQTSTFEMATAAELGDVLEFRAPGHAYTRHSNPTHAALESAMAELEGGEAAQATASGMAAVHAAMLSYVRSGDEVLAPRNLYGGTFALLRTVLDRYGVTHRFIPATDPDAYEAAIGSATRLIWAETIANPTADLTDIPALAEIAHRHGLPLVVDNTFASPYLCNPLALGADLVVHSMTKYIGGHSDLVGGVVVGSADRVAAAREVVIKTGGNAQPLEAFLALRGLKTLALRMERHSETALRVATALTQEPSISRVLYAGLAGHPQHALGHRLLRDGKAGGMMAIELAGGRPAGEAFLERLEVAVHATSLGSVETLCSHPASSSHRQLSDEELLEAGLSPGLIRISIGVEDADDLIADFRAAAPV